MSWTFVYLLDYQPVSNVTHTNTHSLHPPVTQTCAQSQVTAVKTKVDLPPTLRRKINVTNGPRPQRVATNDSHNPTANVDDPLIERHSTQ